MHAQSSRTIRTKKYATLAQNDVLPGPVHLVRRSPVQRNVAGVHATNILAYRAKIQLLEDTFLLGGRCMAVHTIDLGSAGRHCSRDYPCNGNYPRDVIRLAVLSPLGPIIN